MFELYACVGMYFGLCGQIHRLHFDSLDECRAELVEVRKWSDVKIAYCRKVGPAVERIEETK